MSNYNQLKNASILNPTGNVDLGSPTNAYGNVYMVGNLAIGTTTVSGSTIISPRVNSIVYPGDDTAADPAGGQTITLNGAGFVTGASVLIGSTAASVVSVINSTQISFTSPAMSSGSYVLYIVNPSGATGISIPGLQYSGTPAWSTPAGSLGTGYESAAISNTLTATGDAPIIYSLQSGTLPPGSTLNSGTGLLSGTASSVASSTTYNFTIRATDAQNQDTDRAFSLTVSPDIVTWSAPANNSTTTTYEYTDISNVAMSATSAAGKSITYTANSLPTGITIDGANITGTPTTVGSTSTLLTGTAATTNKTATRTVNFVVNQDVVTWSSPADNTTTSAYIDQLMANVTMSASSAAGKSITYTANALPTGLSISGANITGTPTVAASSSSLVTATASTTNRTATRTFNWVVSVANDTYFKNVSLLLNGETTVTPFISDASTNSLALTINGDTKPTLFSPYQSGYYSNYFNGSSWFALSNASQSALTANSDFTFESWVYLTGYQGTYNTIMGGATGDIAIAYNSSSGWGIYCAIAGSAPFMTSGMTPLNSMFNRWAHVALTRSGNSWNIWVDGTSVASATNTSTSITNSTKYIGNEGSTNYPMLGYLSNARFTSAALYTTTFTPPTTPLTTTVASGIVKLLTCQSNRFIDTSTNAYTLTITSVPQISPNIPFTASSSYSTYGSTYFSGSSSMWLAVPINATFAFGTNNYTYEAWVYPTAFPNSYNTVFCNFRDDEGNKGWSLLITGTGLVHVNNQGTYNNSTTALSLNTWTHLAVCRVGNTVTRYINGVADATTITVTASITNVAAQGITIGGSPEYSSARAWTGYISNARVISGTALYTSNFTPSTSPLTAIANTQLLTCQYNGGANNYGIIDNSNFNNIITRAGNTSQGTFSPYSVTGWSNFVNNAYIATASSSQFIASGNGFTIEAWVYYTVVPSYTFIVATTTGAGGYNPYWFIGSSPSLTWRLSWGDYASVDTGVTFSLNTWYHVAMSMSSAGSGTFYVNGVSRATATGKTLNGSATGIVIGDGGGSIAGSYPLGAYISNVRYVNNSSVYTGAFTPSTSPLTPIAGTQLLTCQSNRFIDNSPNNFALTLTSTSVPLSVQAFGPFGSIPEAVPISYSVFFDGTGDDLTTTTNAVFTFGTGDFTIEMWVYVTANPGDYAYFYAQGPNTSASMGLYLSAGKINVWNGSNIIVGSTTYSLNRWYHVALSRTGTSLKLFLDGVQDGSATNSSNITTGSTYGSTVARWVEIGDSRYFAGYISNLRVVKGTAVYTSAFTPPTTPLTAISGTSLLTCQSTRIIDNSANAFTLTAAGDVKPRIFNPFGYTAQSATSYTPSLHGGSAYFDGTGDYVQVSTDFTAVNSGTSNFTYEAWVYFDSVASGTVIGGGNSDGNIVSAVSIYLSASGTLRVYGPSVSGTVTTTVVAKQWYHIAVTRSTNTFTLWLNGISQGTFSDSGSVTYASTSPLTIGRLGQYAGFYTTGYISDVRVTKGTAIYTSNFVPPSQTLTNYSTTYPASLLLNFNNGGIIDYHSSNVLETLGNAQLSTAVKKYNVSSMYFDGTGDYLNIPYSQLFNFSTGDFTVECWANITYVQYSAIISSTNSTMSSSMWLLGFSNTAHIMTFNFDGSGAAICGADYTAYEGVWTHIAVSRSGTTLKLFFNGTQVQSVTNSTSFTGDTANTVTIGRRYNNQTQYYMNGYLDDLRITKGVARYTANFTPPSSALITK